MAGSTDFYREMESNKRKSWLLMLLIFFIFLAISYAFALVYGELILIFGLAFSIAYIAITYAYGSSMLLRHTGARPVNEKDPKELQFKNMVENLAFAARLPAPKTYVIETDEMNAFATGKKPEDASVAITTGLLKKLNRDELEGVVAHEVSHIQNYDIRFATMVAIMVGLVAMMSYMFLRMGRFGFGGGRSRGKGGGAVVVIIILGILLAIISPFLVRMVQAAVSRKREFLADSSGAMLTRYPEGLARALGKIKGNNKGTMQVSEAVSHLFFTDPTHSYLDSVFATHPPIDERVKKLRSM